MGDDGTNENWNGKSLLSGLHNWGRISERINPTGTYNSVPLPPPPPVILRSVDNLWFNQKDVVLDGWCFSSCRFDNCRIFLNSQHFELKDCLIDAGSNIYYQNNTVNIIRLFNSRFGAESVQHPHFNAHRKEDGTISIVR